MKKLLSIILISSVLILCTSCSDDDDNVPIEPTNVEKSIAILKALETGDVSPMQNYINPNQYIQHNLAFPDGAAVVINATQSGAFNGTTVNTVKAFIDGDIIVCYSEYGGTWNNGTPQAAFDVFRFENGLAVEHWDDLEDVVSDTDGTTQFDGDSTPAINVEQTKANRAFMEVFSQDFFIDGEYDRIDEFFNVDGFIHHSPGFGVDISGLENFVLNVFGVGNPLYSSIEFIQVEGNFALLQSQGFPDSTTGLSTAFYDLFRIEDGKIIEHWDVLQTIPAEADWANTNGKW